MTKKLSITIFIFVISLCVYSNKLVSGTVVDCKTNLPIPGAEIIINNSKNNQTISQSKHQAKWPIIQTNELQTVLCNHWLFVIALTLGKECMTFFKVRP